MKDIIFHSTSIEELRQVVRDEIQKGFAAYTKSNHGQIEDKIQYLTRKETAKSLKVTLPTLRAWTKSGKVKAYQIGRRVLYRADQIDQAPLEQLKIVRK